MVEVVSPSSSEQHVRAKDSLSLLTGGKTAKLIQGRSANGIARILKRNAKF